MSGKNHSGGPGERVPEGTHLDVLLRMEALVRDTSAGYAAGVIHTLATGSTLAATALDRICHREGAHLPPAGPSGGKRGPSQQP